MDLKCRKTSCKYNDYFTCRAKSIAIDDKLKCDSYENEPNKKVRDTSCCMFDEAPKYAPQRAKKHMRVACAAKCIFNEQGTCIANGLTINDINHAPNCMTFLKP